MTPETATEYLHRVWTEGDRVRVTFRPGAPADVLPALRGVRPAILLLATAARRARCCEPLLVLVHEFRQDLEQMAAGAWTVEAVADAITTIGAVDGWQFSKRKTV